MCRPAYALRSPSTTSLFVDKLQWRANAKCSPRNFAARSFLDESPAIRKPATLSFRFGDNTPTKRLYNGGMARAFAIACLLLSSGLLYSQHEPVQTRDSLNDSLGRLARANNLDELARQWSQAPKDYPHRAVHAATYANLKGRNPDAVLIRAMPVNGKEMEALYDAQDTRQGQDMAVTQAYGTFYTQLANALRRHPQRLPQFFKMIHSFHYVDNVDEWPILCELASRIYDTHPDEYKRAASRLSPQFRREAMECKQAPDVP